MIEVDGERRNSSERLGPVGTHVALITSLEWIDEVPQE